MTAARPRLDVLAVIALGGVIGATARLAIARAFPMPDEGFPVATFATNVIGSFLLGVLVVVGADLMSSRPWVRPFLVVGVIGSFTTFSTFAVEHVLLVDRGRYLLAAFSLVAMLATGLAAALLGIASGRRLGRRAASG